MTLSARAARLRRPLGFFLAVLYVAIARPTPLTLPVGAAIAFAGLVIRAWAAGHIDKNKLLATSG
ncbi:MAG: isoprenylcysteine carboxylmethyltransferase family protein, partial [Chloroflexota bacterium]|nr:isoprenylcysteine carboxylmethyltransferase family protein [Chloroflexota bacterium]